MSRHFVFLIASGRRGGNSELLARRAAAALPADVERTWIHLDDHPLPPFRDLRHDGTFPEPDGAARMLAEATLRATDLVLVTPVYWYSLPATAKLYLDHWSAWMRTPSLDFRARMRGRRLWAVVVDSSEPDDRSYAPLVETLVRSAEYLEMRWSGALHGHGNRPGDALADSAAAARADGFFGEAAAAAE